MTEHKAKAEAEKIIKEFKNHTFHHSDKSIWDRRAKNCAIIDVKHTIDELELFNYKLTPLLAERIMFYESVLTEIEKTI